MKKFLHRWVGLALAAVIGAGCGDGKRASLPQPPLRTRVSAPDIDPDAGAAGRKLLQRALVQRSLRRLSLPPTLNQTACCHRMPSCCARRRQGQTCETTVS
ncbi:MAG: hypothetical protein ACLSAP_02280 [Oscillospiraceae bacterium]